MISSFILASILIELTPGPNMTWLAILGATRGRTTALAAVAGVCLGLAIAATVAGLGLAAVFYRVPQLFSVLRWAGTFYLLYLAWDAWKEADTPSITENQSPYQALLQGLVSNILNPKAYLFYAAILPQFLEPARDMSTQIILLSSVYVAIATVIHASIAIMAGGISDWLAKSPRAVTLRKGLALLLAATAIWFFYSAKVQQ